MSATLAHVFRHPVKSLGREALDSVVLSPGAWLPGDRLWAVTHERSKIEGDGWARCANFLRCTHGPSLMAVTGRLGADGASVALRHPAAGPLDLEPDAPGAFDRLAGWLSGIWPDDLPQPTGLWRYSGGSLTDNPNPWLSVHTLASHRAVEQRIGRDLSIHRWRGNLWLDGLAPWQEFEWPGQQIRIGDTTLQVEERIGRCKATHANPETGERDVDMLGTLRSWEHQDFGVFARVVGGGEIRIGDPVTVPA